MTKKKRGFGGTCAIVVEQAGSKRKVVADMAEARTLVKRLAERHPTKQVKVTRACSTGRGARGETIAACTGRKCWGALSGVSGTRSEHPYLERDLRGAKPRVTFDLDKQGHIRKAWLHVDGRRVDVSKIAQQEYSGSRLERAASKLHDAKSSDGAVQALRKAAGINGVRGTREQHQEQVETYLRDAEFFVDRAQKSKGGTRRGLALRAFKRVEQAEAVCGWAGGNCNEEVIGLREEVLPMLMTSQTERKAYDGLGGVRGTSEQHEAAAGAYAAAAQRALEYAAGAKTAKMRRTFLRTAQRQVDAGQTECTWVAGRDPKGCREVRAAAEALYFAETKRAPRSGASGTRRRKKR
jgi:hypothetical protein